MHGSKNHLKQANFLANKNLFKGVIFMANIFWNSYSINNFFNASLNRGNSTFGSFYSNLGDAAMIKSGTYKKLMKSYFNEAKSDSSSKSTSSSDSSSKKRILILTTKMATRFAIQEKVLF